MGTITYLFYTRGKIALQLFPAIDTQKVIYHEKRASGFSTQSLITKLGGSRNGLEIVVTETELWLKGSVFTASILEHHDLIHRISLDKIKRVDYDFSRRKITIDFTCEEGTQKQVVIQSRDPQSLLSAIQR